MKYRTNAIIIGVVLLLLSSCVPTSVKTSLYSNSDAEYEEVYKDQLDEGSTLIKSWYYYTVEKTKKYKYVLKTYFPETKQKTSYTTFSDPQLQYKNGVFMEWNDDGELLSKGQYINNTKTGKWEEYSYSGRKFLGKYYSGKKDGLWQEYDKSGVLRSEIIYKKGVLNGECKWFDSKGDIVRKANYKLGAVLSSEVIKDQEESEIYENVEEAPSFVLCSNMAFVDKLNCNNAKLKESIFDEIKYPPRAKEKGLTGTAIIRFVIEKNGDISNISVVRGLNEEIKNECLRVVNNMPNWSPGKVNGKAVSSYFTLPIKFDIK